MPKMTHPQGTHPINPDEDQVPLYEQQGWQLAAPKAPRAAKKTAAKKAAAKKTAANQAPDAGTEGDQA